MKSYKYYLKNNFHLVITSVVIFFFLILFNNENGFHFNHKTIYVKSAIPQGWAFFTRNARENQISIFKVEKNGLKLLNQNSSLNVNLALGLKRTNRRISLIMGMVTNQPIKWKNFINDKSLLNDKEFNKYYNKSNDDSTLEKGVYILISEERIPWAWVKNFKNPKIKYYKFIVE